MKQYINTPKGRYYFTPISLYLGRKQMDKNVAKNNLILLNHLAKDQGLKLQLGFGTLLGAIREHDFIEHDEDIDLILLEEDKTKFLEFLFYVRDYGFNLVRYDRRGDLFSIMRNGEYIDIYIFRHKKAGIRVNNGSLYPEKYYTEVVPYEIFGELFYIPKDYEECLIFNYGVNWRVPIKYTDFKMSKFQKIWYELFGYFMMNISPLWFYKFLFGLKDCKKIKLYNSRIKMLLQLNPKVKHLYFFE